MNIRIGPGNFNTVNTTLNMAVFPFIPSAPLLLKRFQFRGEVLGVKTEGALIQNH